MNLIPISNISTLEKIIDEHTLENTLTNNYILLQDFKNYIKEKRIFYWIGDSNLYLFIQKEGFYRLYYLVNNIDSKNYFSKHQIVLEILFRGNKDFPHSHIDFWKRNGFVSHITRDCYFLNADSIIPFENKKKKGVKIEPAKTREDIVFSKKLIDENLDFYTGDRLTLTEIENFSDRGSLFCAYKDDLICGMLQANLKNNVYWLGHIVVHKDFRGLGLAHLLVNQYLEEGLRLKVRQFQLWVINDNIPAINLYKKKGFKYLNKSTHSLLKKN